ncbi:ATP synthase F1 subunit delta [Sunxiuqinia indica]|uniref:ATP synthase F1 subunit delta n=1 Tax=Sunxiuqinia indica TaxID=2692584 RepID=UPI0013592A32|nr:ATP synthase F1 subunit delta [Sunxiuqinia indica]
MNHSKIAVRYAKAFFSLAKEKKLLDELKIDVSVIAQLTKDSSEFLLLLGSPVIKTSQKVKLLKTIFEKKVNEQTLNFLVLIAENKREAHVPGICRNFMELYRKEQGIKTATITSAISLRKGIISQIQKKLETEFDTKIELGERVNSDLIGGFVLRVDDRQIDASVATQLRKVKENLLQTEINK